MKVAIYCRVSTDEQTTENQKLRLTEYAKRMGWDFEIFEEVMSTRKTRPVKYNLLQLLRKKKFAGLLIYKLDRWARSSRELIMELNELHEKGIQIISVSDNIDLDSSMGQLQFQILSAFAEFERNLIRERTIEGLKRTKKRLGRPRGSKDKKRRRKSGYLLREATKLQKMFAEVGHHYDIHYFVNNPRQIIMCSKRRV